MTVAGEATTPAAHNSSVQAYDVEKIRKEFPVLDQEVNGRPLVYLDNAATTQKPRQVLEVLQHYYAHDNANIHRGVHALSLRATESYEESREKVRRFIHAADSREIVFVRGATEGVNLVAQTYGRRRLGEGDEILLTAMEHHSNIVPWQLLCEEKKARLRVAPINDRGELLLDEFERLLSPRTRLVAAVHMSNSLGTINPVREMTARAHRHGIPVLIDGAQAAPHLRIDVQDLDCDFYVFSGHKMYAPTGIGVLYGKQAHLEEMPPYQGGGDMISSVTFEKTSYNRIPYKFEAGTPNIAGGIALGATIDFLNSLGQEAVEAHERSLLDYATEAVASVPGLRLVGTAREKSSILSFVLDRVHPHDIGTILDQDGIAVRAGHHCTQPLMDRFGVPATVRASFGLYNTRREVELLVEGIRKVREVFG